MEKINLTQLFFYEDISIWGLNSSPKGNNLIYLDRFKDYSNSDLKEFIGLKYFQQEKEIDVKNGEIEGVNFIPDDCFLLVFILENKVHTKIFHKCKKISENEVETMYGKRFYFDSVRDILIS